MKMNLKSEFRKDIVSGEWILISSARRGRPLFFKKERAVKKNLSKRDCPFENPQKNGNSEPILWYPAPHTPKEKQNYLSSWFLQLIPNKYPAVTPNLLCPEESKCGPYKHIDGGGFHEVIITRHHNLTIAEMEREEVFLMLNSYRERYLQLKTNPCLSYIFIFHNHGKSAGASIPHPHSQLMALPIIPPDVSRSLSGSARFWQKEKKCVHCVMLRWEEKEKKRLIFQNKAFLVLAPYASRVNYEIRIFPRYHRASFEKTDDGQLFYLAEALKVALFKIKEALGNPDYNFFIHTSPLRAKNSGHYHWHIEILPKTSHLAGFELGTGVELISVFPEETAKILRRAKIR